MTMKSAAGIFILYFLLGSVCASSIGVGPSTLDYARMSRGGYAERQVTVSTSGNDELTCYAEFSGEIKDWMRLEEGTIFSLQANSRKTLTLSMQIPETQSNGKYAGSVYLRAQPSEQASSQTGMSVGAGVRIRVSVEIVGEQDSSLHLSNLFVGDSQVGSPIPVEISAVNTGTARFMAQINLTVRDHSKKTLSSYMISDMALMPHKTEKISVNISSSGIMPGTYTLSANVLANGVLADVAESRFRVLPVKTGKFEASLEKLILSDDVLFPSQMSTLTATVKNKGETPINARLKVEAHTAEGLYKTLPDSEIQCIGPKDEADMVTYFSSSYPGSYILHAYVEYEGKTTNTRKIHVAVLSHSISHYLPHVAGLSVLIIFAALSYRKLSKWANI